MQTDPITKYRPFPAPSLPDRTWPNRRHERCPVWCSVDLRDGNQALAIPMNVEEKLEMFALLVSIGFKEIEVGFPSASAIEFEFIRRLIEENRIPEDVTIQVLTQSRKELIEKTFASLQGVHRAILHLYNSTSPTQRRVVFNLGREAIKEIAVSGTRMVRELASTLPDTELVFEYSPESFSDTEVEYALEVCEAVSEVWQPTPEAPMILNLPATVEVATPNIYADQIEWFCRHLNNRAAHIISLHTHNDRGTGVAATELGLLAGGDRVEGTLFGNGERTGNVDLVTVALNLYTQGLHPGLDFSQLNHVREVYERTTRMDVHVRHPYSGELVFTAFSGSHQDAIKKGMHTQSGEAPDALWQVPYLPIDPQDLGRNYRAIIRINSQSGKGGVAYIMEKEFGFQLPKNMHRELGRLINEHADRKGLEITPAEVHSIFLSEYIERQNPLSLERIQSESFVEDQVTIHADLGANGEKIQVTGTGNGPIDAFVQALTRAGVAPFELLSYSEHSLGSGADSKAVAYIEIRTSRGQSLYGAGMDTNIERASLRAVLSAVNRAGLFQGRVQDSQK